MGHARQHAQERCMFMCCAAAAAASMFHRVGVMLAHPHNDGHITIHFALCLSANGVCKCGGVFIKVYTVRLCVMCDVCNLRCCFCCSLVQTSRHAEAQSMGPMAMKCKHCNLYDMCSTREHTHILHTTEARARIFQIKSVNIVVSFHALRARAPARKRSLSEHAPHTDTHKYA